MQNCKSEIARTLYTNIFVALKAITWLFTSAPLIRQLLINIPFSNQNNLQNIINRQEYAYHIEILFAFSFVHYIYFKFQEAKGGSLTVYLISSVIQQCVFVLERFQTLTPTSDQKRRNTGAQGWSATAGRRVETSGLCFPAIQPRTLSISKKYNYNDMDNKLVVMILNQKSQSMNF